jgi:hypothetical protein
VTKAAYAGHLTAVRAAAVATLLLSGVGIRDGNAADESSAESFAKMAAVLQHPRCMNCHTREEFPRQGDDRHVHSMHVARGPDNDGAAGLHCRTCHQNVNQPASGVPGAADWHLAPLRMAWEGLSVGELCRAIRSPDAGGMPPEKLVEHLHTSLVVWAWSPGVDAHGRARSIPPMSFDDFIALTRRWIDSGATCPR